MKKKVLATSWHPGGINAIVPVIKRLREDSRIETLIIGHEFSEQVLDEQGLDYRKISDYGVSDVSYESMLDVLRQSSPDLVLTGASEQDDDNKVILEHSTIFSAKELSIPSLGVIDFWTIYSSCFSDTFTHEKNKYVPDKIAALPGEKSLMVADGFDPDIIVETGNPHFDRFYHMRGDKAALRERHGLDDGTIFAFASQPLTKHYNGTLGFTAEDVFSELGDAVLSLRDDYSIDLLLKRHPRDERDYSSLLERFSATETYIPTSDLLVCSDAVISMFSTVLVESALLGKPSISLQPNLQKEDVLLTNELGMTIPVYKKGEVYGVLKSVLDGSYSQASGLGLTDGKATDRVTALVYGMLGMDQ